MKNIPGYNTLCAKMAACAAALWLYSLPGGQAATLLFRWTGGSATSGNWSTGANWLGGVSPTGGDQRLIFTADAARKVNTNNLAAGTVFESIWIVDDGYNIYGNSVSIDYLRADYSAGGSSTFRPDIVASGLLQIIVDTNNSTLVIAGDISLGNHDLYLPNLGPGDVTISGVISGTGSLLKYNTGDLRLSGFGANTFSGSTHVTAGILRLNRSSFFGGTVAIPGDLVIGAGTSGPIGHLVVLENDHQIANTSHVTIHGSGALECVGHNDTIGALTLNAGTVATGGGVLTLGGNVRVQQTTKDSVINGRLNLGAGAERIFDVALGGDLNVGAEISGGTGVSLVKSNLGTMTLSGSNVFSGSVELVGGTMRLEHGSALGQITNGVLVKNGIIEVAGTIGVNDALNVVGLARLLQVSGSASWNGSMVLERDLAIIVETNSALNIAGKISGSAGWRKTGEGTLQLKTTYTNTYGGTGWVQQGNMILDGVFHQPVISGTFIIGTSNGIPGSERVGYIKHGQIADDAPVILLQSGVLALQGFTDTIGSLEGRGNVELMDGTLVVGANNTSTTYAGIISGTGSLAKTGSATLTLTGTNTYTGVTSNLNGLLMVNGRLNGSSAVQVRPGSTLGGTGQVQVVSVFSNGHLRPGTSPGNLTMSSLLLPNGGVFHVELNGTATANYDRLTASGSVTLGGVLALLLGFTPAHHDSFMIIHKTGAGPVSGTFAGLPEGQIFTQAGLVFQITYAGGDGNDVVLRRVPGPASSIYSIAPGDGGSMAVNGFGLPKALYTLEATTNLNPPIVWTTVGTEVSDGTGAYVFIDSDAALHPMRFYRVISP